MLLVCNGSTVQCPALQRSSRPYYRTVQGAVDAARSGDWILVYPGVYHEKSKQWPTAGVWVQKPNLHIRGLDRNRVIIDGSKGTAAHPCPSAATQQDFAPRGLVILGLYTPKPRPRPTSVEDVRKTVDAYRFRFPVAVDDGWKALRRLWLDRSDSGWTSASLLIDRAGVVRHVHPGGVFAKDSADPQARRDYDEMRTAVERLLDEKEILR